MKKLFLFFCFFIALALFFPSVGWARIGVGIGTGKIVIENQLKPGEIYKLPQIGVLNTGDETAEYEVGITYHEKQPELKPPEQWFNFKPQKFELKPGDVKMVDIYLDLPLKAIPGNYFAYIEGRPIVKTSEGSTKVGIAAATKLYFTLVPANILWAFYYKVRAFWQLYDPWPGRIVTFLGLILLVLIFKKFFNVQINLKKKSKNE